MKTFKAFMFNVNIGISLNRLKLCNLLLSAQNFPSLSQQRRLPRVTSTLRILFFFFFIFADMIQSRKHVRNLNLAGEFERDSQTWTINK